MSAEQRTLSECSDPSPPTPTTPTTPNQNTPNICHRCQEPIKTVQFIRVGSYKFHKQHFSCYECDTPLHGQKFHHKDAKFFCASCFVKKFCHTCRHCGDKILHGSVIQAFGGFYHPEHFVCKQCEKPFPNGKYYEYENQPYCEEHYFYLTLEKCSTCNKPVQDNEMVRVQGRVYHNTCLTCSHCGIPLARKGSIFQKENKVYCRNDYLNFFCKRCTACSEHILKHCVSVNDEFYHPDCLKCDICDIKLDKYICVSGHLRCADHAEFQFSKIPCSVCNKEIDDEVVMAVGKKVHQECFLCAFCNCSLEKLTCKLKDNKLCCPSCLMIKDNKTNNNVSSDPSKSASRTRRPASDSMSPNVSSESDRKSNTSLNSSLSPNEQEEISTSISTMPIDEVKTQEVQQKRKKKKDSVVGTSATGQLQKTFEWKKGELIGKGSFGKVYMGMNAATGELMAVKQIMINTAEDQEHATAIQTEITLMENLKHPNIVTLLGTERQGNKLNIFMEYVPGKSLDTLLEKFGAFSETVVRHYTKQLLEALAYCHSNRVVHRDIKGKNILIDTKGNLKLADFGSAKRFTNVMSKDAPSLSYNYTPLWTAPEVLLGDYNSKVDVWSLGCVIIEMCTAKPPWSEQNFENPFRALYHIGNSNSIPTIPSNLSELGKDFILQCLRRDPDQRPDAKTLLQHPWLQNIDKEEEKSDSDDDDDSDDEHSSALSSQQSRR